MKSLSAKRVRLLQLVGQYQHSDEFPLVRQLAADLGLAGESSLRSMLQALVQEGLLSKHGGGRERTQCVYRLTDKAAGFAPAAPGRLRLPRIGVITAGPWREAVQECEEFVDAGEGLRVQPGDFLLEVDGDSMIGDGILPGDLVQVRPDTLLQSGAIAAVQIRHDSGVYESTLKHVHYQQGQDTVFLRASNPKYEEMAVPAGNVEVVGVYKGLIRPSV